MTALLLTTSLIVLILMLIQWSLSSFSPASDPQLSSLESGFENIMRNSLLSSSFFLMAILFVLFDVELILLLPCVFFHYCLVLIKFFNLVLLLSFLLITLLLEWWLSGLKWQN